MSATPQNGKAVWQYSLVRRKVLEIRDDHRVQSPAELAGLMRALGLTEMEQEHFVVFHLDAKHKLKAYVVVTVGLIDRSPVHAREVFRSAILNGASRIVLAHNHPSGDPTPSSEDIAVTRNLAAAGKIIGIEVLDHVICGAPNRPRPYVSLREENLL